LLIPLCLLRRLLGWQWLALLLLRPLRLLLLRRWLLALSSPTPIALSVSASIGATMVATASSPTTMTTVTSTPVWPLMSISTDMASVLDGSAYTNNILKVVRPGQRFVHAHIFIFITVIQSAALALCRWRVIWG
jgi:hypothetical protein